MKLFDVQAVLAEIQNQAPAAASSASFGDQNGSQEAKEAEAGLGYGQNRSFDPSPDVERFEERAAIAEFDGGLSRIEAENIAAQCQGYANVVAFRAFVSNADVQNGKPASIEDQK